MRFSGLHVSLISFFLGIFYASFFHVSQMHVFLFVVIVSGVLVTIFLLRRWITLWKIPFSFAVLAITFFCLGVVRLEIFDAKQPDPMILRNEGKKIALQGVVDEEPDMREKNLRIIVSVRSVAAQPVSGRLVVTVDRFSDIRYGDLLLLSGTLERPSNIDPLPGERPFDYVSYLAKDGIYFQMRSPRVSVVARGKGNPAISCLLGIKSVFVSQIDSIMNPPQSSLLAGITIAGKRSLSSELQSEFQRAGVSHVIVLSGYNVTLAIAAMLALLAPLPRRWRLLGGALGAIGFSLMAGATATVLRSVLMALASLTAQSAGRTYDPARALFLAAFAMLMWNPKLLGFDPSFQLSFISTGGLMLMTPFVAGWFGWVPETMKLRETVVSTVGTQLFVLPYLLWQIGLLSLVALPVNMLVLAPIPLTMLLGTVSVLLSFISISLSYPVTLAAYLLLSYELGVVRFFSSLPFAAVQVSAFPAWLMFSCYGVIGFFLIRFYRKEQEAGQAASGAVGQL